MVEFKKKVDDNSKSKVEKVDYLRKIVDRVGKSEKNIIKITKEEIVNKTD